MVAQWVKMFEVIDGEMKKEIEQEQCEGAPLYTCLKPLNLEGSSLSQRLVGAHLASSRSR